MENKKVQKKVKSEKNNNQKKHDLGMIIILFVIIIAIVVIILVVNKNKENKVEVLDNANIANVNNQITTNDTTENVTIDPDGKKENVSEKLKSQKTFENIIVKNIELAAKDEITKFTALAQNNSTTDFIGKPVQIIFLNEKGEDVYTLEAYIGDTKVGENSKIEATITADFTNVYDFKIINKI